MQIEVVTIEEHQALKSIVLQLQDKLEALEAKQNVIQESADKMYYSAKEVMKMYDIKSRVTINGYESIGLLTPFYTGKRKQYKRAEVLNLPVALKAHRQKRI